MLAFLPPPDYTSLFVLLCGMTFFARAARAEGRSPVMWGAISLGSWWVVTTWVVGGIAGAALSQGLVFVGLAIYAVRREEALHRARTTARQSATHEE